MIITSHPGIAYCDELNARGTPPHHGFSLWISVECRTVARKLSVGGLYICTGGLDIQIWQKFHKFTVFHISILGDLELCLGG